MSRKEKGNVRFIRKNGKVIPIYSGNLRTTERKHKAVSKKLRKRRAATSGFASAATGGILGWAIGSISQDAINKAGRGLLIDASVSAKQGNKVRAVKAFEAAKKLAPVHRSLKRFNKLSAIVGLAGLAGAITMGAVNRPLQREKGALKSKLTRAKNKEIKKRAGI